MNYIENNGLYYRNIIIMEGTIIMADITIMEGTITMIITTITEVDGAGVVAHGAVDFSQEVLLEAC